jgi:dTDP-4-amino-4,6-dideoxygalactose transaminase
MLDSYLSGLKSLEEKGKLHLPQIPDYASNNAHMFYLVSDSLATRYALIAHLKEKNIHAVFHYLSLNKSEFYLRDNESVTLPNADHFTDTLIRLPFYFNLTTTEQSSIIQ